jgi:CubicO group peptidase (beta-lactamase class C family)
MGTVVRLIAWGLAAFCAAASASAPAPAPAAPRVPTEAPAAHSLDRGDVESWLDGFMPYALERGDCAGAVVAVVKNGAVLLVKGYGVSNVDTRAPVDPERTLFRPGSTSKLFTWTAVMQLVEQGKLDLDHDVNEYLGFRLPARDDGPITLRHIMTHTAGFEEQIKELIIADPQRLVPLKTYVERATPTRIFKAGTTPAYSNYATALAGYIVERVSGQKFDDYLDAHIFKPLGMVHATFRQPLPSALAPEMSQGYGVASEPAKPFEIVVAAPAGSLSASGADMARFMIAHLEGGAYGDGRILSAETVKLMHETPLTMIPPLNRMMLGFYEQNYNGHRVISHGGDTEYFHSYLHLFLDDHVGLFVSINSAGREGAAHAIREALFEEFARRYFPAPAETGAVDAATATADAKALAGYYDDSRRADRSFLSLLALIQPVQVGADKDGRVSVSMLKGLNQATRYYREVQPFVWLDAASGWRLAARVVDGRVVRFSADEVSPFMVFEPVPWWRSPAWLRPAAGASLLACLLTALLWPVAAIVRRRYGVVLGLGGREARGRLVSRLAAVAISAVTAGWATIIVMGLQHLEFLGPRIDALLMAMYAVSVVAYVGGAAAMLWSAYVTWTGHRPWLARLWTTALALAALALLWTAWVYHLMSFQTNY